MQYSEVRQKISHTKSQMISSSACPQQKIVREIEAMSFKLFVTEAEWFFSKDEDMKRQMKNVKLCDLRLSDMGNTTLGVTAPPYDEIAQEAFSVWELFK